MKQASVWKIIVSFFFLQASHLLGNDFEKALAQFQEKGIEPLSEDIYTNLYQITNEALHRFFQTLQEKKHRGAYTSIKLNGFKFMSATINQMNAQVQSPWTMDGEPKNVSIFVGTDHLATYFQWPSDDATTEAKTQAVRRGVGLLFATLAHEVGHQSKAFKKGQSRLESQYEEARADAVAIELLRKAGYPRHYIVDLIDLIGDEQRRRSRGVSTSRRAISSGLSSHPAGEIRESLTRQAVTLDSFNNGGYEEIPIAISPHLVEEIAALIRAKAAPLNLTQVFSQWEQSQLKANSNFCSFVSSMIWAQWAIALFNDTTAEQQTAFLRLLTQLQKTKRPAKKQCQYPQQAIWSEVESTLTTHPFFLTEEYYQAINSPVLEPALKLQRYLPAPFQVRHFLETKFLELEYEFYTLGAREEDRKKFDKDLNRALVGAFADNIARLQPEHIINALYKKSLESRITNILTLQQDALESGEKRQLKVIAGFLWEHRSLLSAAEFEFFIKPSGDFSGYIIAWDAVSSLLERPEDMAKRELFTAFSEQIIRPLPDFYRSIGVKKGKSPLVPFGIVQDYFAEDKKISGHIHQGMSPKLVRTDVKLYWDIPELAEWLLKKSISHSNLIYRNAVGKITSLQNKLVEEFTRINEISLDDPKKFAQKWKEYLQTITPLAGASGSSYPLLSGFLEAPLRTPYRNLRPRDWELGRFISNIKELDLDTKLFEWIEEQEILPEKKGALIRELLGNSSKFCQPFSSALQQLWPKFKQYSVFLSFRDAFWFAYVSKADRKQFKCPPVNDKSFLKKFLEEFYAFIEPDFLEYTKNLLVQEIPIHEVLKILEPYFIPPHLDSKNKTPITRRRVEKGLIPKVKALLVERLLAEEQTVAQAIKYFEMLSVTGITYDVDRYFHWRLLPLLKDSDYNEEFYSSLLRGVGDASNLRSQTPPTPPTLTTTEARAEVFKIELAQDMAEQADFSYAQALQKLLALFDKPSITRDELLEHISWKTLPTLEELRYAKEHHKTNPASTDYKLRLGLRLGSALSQYMADWTNEQKNKIVRYVVRPEEKTLRDIISHLQGGSAKIRNKEVMLREIAMSRPEEKIPLIELLLGAESEREADTLFSSEYFQALKADILGFEAEDLKDRVLTAYLSSIPDYERYLAFAYLLATSQGQGGGVKSIFEVFTTVGVKTGQLAAIWDIFDNPFISSELEDLKDEARPMDKLAIYETLQAILPGDIYDNIADIPQLLGSASIKTVARVVFKDESQKVVMLRRPKALALVKENLQRTRRFLAALQNDEDLRAQTQALSGLLEIVEQELEEELDFSLEVQKATAAGAPFGSSQDPLRVDSWEVRVPDLAMNGLVFKDLQDPKGGAQAMFMELAENTVTYRQIRNEALKAEVGQLIVRVSFHAGFYLGFFNADPHQGNFLVNTDAKILYPIDFGQAEQLNCPAIESLDDERKILAKFLLAVGRHKPHNIASAGLLMTRQDASGSRATLVQALQGKDSFKKIIMAFGEANTPLQKKYFGILKGLAILEKEEYVPKAHFHQLIEEEVANLALAGWRKRIYMLTRSCKAFFRK